MLLGISSLSPAERRRRWHEGRRVSRMDQVPPSRRQRHHLVRDAATLTRALPPSARTPTAQLDLTSRVPLRFWTSAIRTASLNRSRGVLDKACGCPRQRRTEEGSSIFFRTYPCKG